jgi:hypothetical protein
MASIQDQIKKLFIILLILVVIFQLYYLLTGDHYGDRLAKFKLIDLPHSIKCYFNESQCETGYIDGWSLLSALIYLIAGYLIPGQHFWALSIAIVTQFIQPYFGIHSKYIVDPLIDITAYSIGSLFSKYSDTSTITTITTETKQT